MITQEETREKLGLTQQFKGGNLVKCRMRKLVRENTEARGDYPWMTSNVLQSETDTDMFWLSWCQAGVLLKANKCGTLAVTHSTSTAARTNYATDMPAFNQEAD